MAKAALYVAARAPGRVSKAQEERALSLFLSSGNFKGLPEEVAGLANYCLEHKKGFALSSVGRDDWTIARVVS